MNILTRLGQGVRLFGTHVGANKCLTHAAAIAYCVVVSIFLLLLLVNWSSGPFMEENKTQEQVFSFWPRDIFLSGLSDLFAKTLMPS